MELVEQIRQEEHPPALLETPRLTDDDVFARSDPCNAIWAFKDLTMTIVMMPLYSIYYLFPLRYLTSIYRIFVIIEVLLYLTDGWRDSMMSGATFILALYVPMASTVVLVYAEELRHKVYQRYGPRLYIYHHCIMHVVPTIVIFATLPLPHPPFLMSTVIVLVVYLVYGILLYLIWNESFLSNYFILDGPTQLSVLLQWAVCLLFSCALLEFLFWHSLATLAVHG
jgi:hypothetical protein